MSSELSREQIDGFRIVLANWTSRDSGTVQARWQTLCDMALAHLDSTEAERQRDEARKDAERYRWIRQEAAKSIEDEDLSDELWAVWEFLLQGNNDPDEMDAAIDAAKSQEK